MRFLPSPCLLLGLCLATAVGCSAGTSTTSGDGDGGPNPNPTATGTAATDPPPDKPDASTDPKPDASAPIDKTVRFNLTLDGTPITVAKTSVKIEPGTAGGPSRVVVEGSYEQTGTGPFTSTATFSVRADTTAKGSDACGTGGRSANYLFKDTDGSIRGLGTVFQGGSCTMNVLANESDGFTSGTSTGVVGGAKQKAYTITWGQPLPAK